MSPPPSKIKALVQVQRLYKNNMKINKYIYECLKKNIFSKFVYNSSKNVRKSKNFFFMTFFHFSKKSLS